MRTLFGKPIRQGTTGVFYPKQMTVEEFADRIGLEKNHGFIPNMNNLQVGKQYIERWAELFLAWSEIENEQSNN